MSMFSYKLSEKLHGKKEEETVFAFETESGYKYTTDKKENFWKIYKLFKCKHFYEVIEGKRKIYFDVDGKPSEVSKEKLLSNLLEAILTRFDDLRSDDLLIFDSSNDMKISFHVIVQKYYCENNDDCKYYCCSIINLMEEEFQEFIDLKVYSKTRCFRLFMSCKRNSERYKVRRSEFHIENEKIVQRHMNDKTIFFKSLITNVKGLTKLPNRPEIKKKVFISDKDVPSHHHEIILAKIAEMKCFSFVGIVNENIFILKRNAPSYCERCKRVHNAENPFIRYDYPYVKFFCRRAENGYEILHEFKIPKKELKKMEKVGENNYTKLTDVNLVTITKPKKKNILNLIFT